MKYHPLFSLLFSFFSLTSAIAQNLIPYLGSTSPMSGEGRYGYATEAGEVVIKPNFKGIKEIMPAGKNFTNLSNPEEERLLLHPDEPYPIGGPAVFLLRSGRRIATDNARDIAVGVQNYSAAGEKLDSIKHLIAFPKSQEIRIYNLRNNTEKTWIAPIRNNSRDWFSRARIPERGYFEPLPFTHGVLEVWKTPGTMNFVDTDLKEIFPRDFSAGRVLDANHFVLAEAVDKYAIGDRSGKIRTPFVWTSIQASGREGFFIVTGPRYNHGKSGITGLINADGKIILDTIYASIMPFGEFLIVRKDNQFGLMDYAGKTLQPITSQNIGPVAENRWLLVVDYGPGGSNPHSNLLDKQGNKMLPEEVRSIGILGGIMKHFLLDFSDYKAFYNADLQEIARFKGIDNGMLVEIDPFVFQLSKIVDGKYQHGLYDREGRMLHPEGFDEIMRIFPDFYRVKKDTLFGVINSKGASLVPVQFLSIKEEIPPNDTLFWGEEASGRWMAFNKKGEKRPESGRLEPSVLKDPVIGIKRSRVGTITGILADGTRITMPDSLKEWNLNAQVHTPTGGLLVFSRYHKNRSETLYFNARMESLIPPGFAGIPLKTYTGLVPLLRMKAESKPWSKPSNKAPEIAAENDLVKSGGEIQEYGPKIPKFDACGVLDTDGKWVLAPKADVIYFPISLYMVLELPIGSEFKSRKVYPDQFRVLRVNQPAQAAIAVNYIQEDAFDKDRKNIKIGKIFPKLRDRPLFTYLDEKGQQLTPFEVWNGPDYLKSRNLLTLVNPSNPKDFKQLIVNDKGETLFDLGQLTCGKMPHEKDRDWHLDYFVVNERISAAETEKLAKMSMAELYEATKDIRTLQGIMDSTGRIVLPLRYLNLQIVASNQLFAAKDSSGGALLFNWEGNLLHRFPKKSNNTYTNSEPVSSLPLAGGSLLVSDGNSCVLLDKNLQIVKVFEESANFASFLEKQFFQIKDKNGNLIWVRTKDGYAFRQ